ncbi:MAG: TIR domain-containing protein [Chloroflexi bacterium]|nr:TIR domain-containing protein [Chloroflexota bacterium]
MTEEKRYDVFLSHNSDDKPLVEELALRLQDEAGLNPWLDAWHIPGGAQWEIEIERALGSCQTCAVVLGEHGWGEYHLRETQAALARQKAHPSLRVIPVFLPGAREEDTDVLPDFFAETQWVDFRGGLNDADALARLITAIRGEVPYPDGRPRLSYLIRRDARRWEQTKRQDESLLYRGDELLHAQQWVSQHPAEMTPLAREFLQASTDLEERQRAARERLRRRIIMGLAIGLAVAVLLALTAWWQRREATTQRDAARVAESRAIDEAAAKATAEANELVAQATAEAEASIATSRELAAAAMSQLETDPERGLLLAMEAVRAAHTFEAEDALRQSLQHSHIRTILWGHEGAAYSASFSPDGKWVVTVNLSGFMGVSVYGPARIWETTTGRMIAVLYGRDGPIRSAAFNADGQRLVTVDVSGTAQLWETHTGGQIAVLSHGAERVSEAIFSPDGRWILTTHRDDNWKDVVQLWQTSNGQQITTLHGHKDRVNRTAFSPDGRWIVTASDDATARLWETSSGQQLAVLQGSLGRVDRAIFSPDGHWILTEGSDDTARVWEANTGKEVAVLHGYEESIYQPATFSNDGQWVLAVSSDTGARVWKAATGEQVAAVAGHEPSWSLRSAIFSPDGEWVVTVGQDDGTARLWKAATGEQAAILCRRHSSSLPLAAFSPDGQWLAVSSDWGSDVNSIKLIDMSTQKWTATLRGHQADITTISFSADGRWILTGSWDGTARIWQAVPQGEVAVLRGHESEVNWARFSPDGHLIVTASFDNARVWDAATGELLATFLHEGLPSIVLSVDGRWLITEGGAPSIRVWDLVGLKEVVLSYPYDDLPRRATFSPDGRWLATLGDDNVPCIWETSTWKPVAFLDGHKDIVWDLTFSPDGLWVATASGGTARVWETTTGREIATLHNPAGAAYVTFSPNGRWIALEDSVWDVTATRQVAFLHGHEWAPTQGTFSPDGRYIMTTSVDGTARIWETVTGQEVAVLPENRTRFRQGIWAAFSPGGHWVATVASRVVKIWKVGTWAEVATLPGGQMAFSPDERLVVTGHPADGTARVWETTTGREVSILRGHAHWLDDVAFSPDGRWVVTAGHDGTARVYAVHIEDLMELAQQRVTREITCQERVQFLHEELECEE